MKKPNQTVRFRAVCRHLLDAGIKPTPTMLEKFEDSFVLRKGVNICLSHGRLSKIRREEFERAGWVFTQRSQLDGGFWVKP